MIQTENKDFSRDVTTKALLNTNRAAFAEHKFRLEQMRTMAAMKADIDSLKSEFAEIKKIFENYKVSNV